MISMADESAGGGRLSGLSRIYKLFAYRVLPTGISVFLTLSFTGLGLEIVGKNSAGYNWVGWIGIAATACVSVAVWFTTEPSEEPEEASRQRVREAERDFEDALRAGQTLAQADPDHGLEPSPGQPETVQGFRARNLALPELWAVTHTRLDHYHEIALGQAKRSFRNAQVAMGLGFSLLVAFVLVALNASTTTGAVVAGGMGAVSAALAGYVSRTFVLSQQAAASHLRAYFDQPLEFSRYLAAERIVMDSGLDQTQRAEVLTMLVKSMVANAQETVPDQGQAKSGE